MSLDCNPHYADRRLKENDILAVKGLKVKKKIPQQSAGLI